MKISVIQLGARMHYAVPRIFFRAGVLATFFTDIISNKYLRSFVRFLPTRLLPRSVRRLIARQPMGLPDGTIKSFPALGVNYFLRRVNSRNSSEMTSVFIWAGKKMNESVIKHGLGDSTTIYCYNSAGLETMQYAKKRGLKCVLEQTIAPRSIENELLLAEHALWPGWEEHPEQDLFLDEFIRREREEWRLADLIVCGSKFVLDGIRNAGGPAKKCVVVPYGVEPSTVSKPLQKEADPTQPLKLLSVGTVGLRKGAPRILKLAQELKNANFRWVGPFTITKNALKLMSKHINLPGSVPRNEIDSHYSWADALILLSVCEGSATVIYEALMRGIPVICSESCGAPRIKGNGLFITPTNDLKKTTAVIKSIGTMKKMGKLPEVSKSLQTYCSLEAYSKRLLSAVRRLS